MSRGQAQRELGGYYSLMPHRVQDILLVASPYDRFVLEEDGRFGDRIFGEYLELDLAMAPRLHGVTTGAEALGELADGSYDLVIATPNIADMTPSELVRAVGERRPDLPLVLLTYDRLVAQTWADLGEESGFDEVFMWTGNPRLLLAIVKSTEDRLNVVHDSESCDVRVILVVEDSPVFYSTYLPILYTEVMLQTWRILTEGLNVTGRRYRRLARPKILLARTFEAAKAVVERYRDHLLGVVLDMRFPRAGVLDPNAGVAMIDMLHHEMPDVPILMQSVQRDHATIANVFKVPFADKGAGDLEAKLRKFMTDHLGFGPFVFQLPDGRVVEEAADLQELMEALGRIPAESVRYHAERNQFSGWLLTRCEFHLAQELRRWSVEDFGSIEGVRNYLIDTLRAFLEQRQRGVVIDYVRGAETLRHDFTRLGGGSMGGKARGLAFAGSLLAGDGIHERHPNVRIFIPRTKVICTDSFDRFVEQGELRDRAREAGSDAEVARLFLSRPLDEELVADLRTILREVRYPLAIRSSSLVEDSAFEPLAGVYETILVPNCSTSDAVRLEQLSRAIRLVYASTFYRGPRSYMEARGMRIEQEKMGVVIQRIVGRGFNGRFYPDFAGVAQSYNLYPIRHLRPADGVASVVLGLGAAVVGGGRSLRFSPRHAQGVPEMSTPDDALKNTQRGFTALVMDDPDMPIDPVAGLPSRSFDLDAARADGTLDAVGATYSPEDHRIHDTIYRPGAPLVNFAGVLKYDRFPLAPLLTELLELYRRGLGTEVEIEFAVSMCGRREMPELGVLQMRRLVCGPVCEPEEVDRVSGDEVRVAAGRALGPSAICGIEDVVYVHPDGFCSRDTDELARVIRRVNDQLVSSQRFYLLAGPGRWGSRDPFLGIPVAWPDVSGARVIVELAIPGYRIEASKGTHFFHNITSLRVGYFTVDLARDGEMFGLDYLELFEPEGEWGPVRHVRLPVPLEVRIDPEKERGSIVAPMSRRRITRRIERDVLDMTQY